MRQCTQGWRFIHKAGGPSATVFVLLFLTVCPKDDFNTVAAAVMGMGPTCTYSRWQRRASWW